MNLYLCIPSLSAHPTSYFKGLITGKVLCYETKQMVEGPYHLLKGKKIKNKIPSAIKIKYSKLQMDVPKSYQIILGNHQHKTHG
jgi:hypothetical protein